MGAELVLAARGLVVVVRVAVLVQVQALPFAAPAQLGGEVVVERGRDDGQVERQVEPCEHVE